jgi:His-Xaa-Ser system protein HxsD
VSQNYYKFSFDSRVYSIDAVRAASYDFWKTSETTISTSDSAVIVGFTCDPEQISNHESHFRQLVLDHQVRIEVFNRTKAIREMIVAQAFAPVENLSEIVEGATLESN